MSTIFEASINKCKKTLHKVIIIADDFTGSNDTGVQLKKYGLSTATILNKDFLPNVRDFDAVVIDSESRSMDKEQAYKTMIQIGKRIEKFKGHSIIFKKIDSTLRGNIIAELEALIDVLRPELIAFAPAYPQNKRTTINGIQYLDNIPLDKSELSNDPKNPIMTADIRQLLTQDTHMEFIHVNIDSIRNGQISSKLSSMSNGYFCFDAESDEDLRKIVKEVSNLNKIVLWVGSAGLADALMEFIYPANKKRPILAVVGSINSISATQAKKVLSESSAVGIKIDIEKVIMSPREEKSRLSSQIKTYIDKGSDVILASALDSQQVIAASTLGKTLGMPLTDISDKIADFIGSVTFDILTSREIGGLFLTGGDTAISVIKKLSAIGSIIIEEIEPGIPLISLLGGSFEGLKVITKAGAFGKSDSILNSIKALKTR